MNLQKDSRQLWSLMESPVATYQELNPGLFQSRRLPILVRGHVWWHGMRYDSSLFCIIDEFQRTQFFYLFNPTPHLDFIMIKDRAVSCVFIYLS